MDARSELLAYMGAALATTAGLFALQIWYASYLDVHVVHADNSDAPLDAKLIATREQEHAKLSSGRMPIDAAKQALASRGRQADPKIAPRASDDLSAMSGWVYRHGFKPYEPRGSRATSVATADLQAVPVSAPPPAGGQAP
jgi:hypothetical protein